MTFAMAKSRGRGVGLQSHSTTAAAASPAAARAQISRPYRTIQSRGAEFVVDLIALSEKKPW